MQLPDTVNFNVHPIDDSVFTEQCKQHLNESGSLVLKNFLSTEAIQLIVKEALAEQHLAFYTNTQHNVYLKKSDPNYADSHVRNRLVTSSKGCITDDQIPRDSILKQLYNSALFRTFLASIFVEQQLFDYADPLSSINIHYANQGQELGWHFDESSFAITLLLQAPETGGKFEYIEDMRDADAGDMNFSGVTKVLDGHMNIKTLSATAGTLTLFRGRNAMHRVTPVTGNTTRILAVLAYNSAANVSLSEAARMTFYGRI